MNSNTETKNTSSAGAAAGSASSTKAPAPESQPPEDQPPEVPPHEIDIGALLQNLDTKMNSMKTNMDSMDTKLNTKVDTMNETMNAKLDRITDALPVAHEHPEVTLAASQKDIEKARRDGGTATWTYGLHQEVPVLVSVLHNLSQVEKRNEYLVFKLTAEVANDLEKRQLAVREIGVHKELYAHKFGKFSQKHDVVLLKLGCSELPEGIHPMEICHQDPQVLGDFHNVVGSSLSGKVYGRSLVFSSLSKCFKFVPDFCEGGNSGTAMFAVKTGKEPRFIRVFQGTAAQKAIFLDRGVIVPVPEEVQWLDIVAVGKPQTITVAGDGDGQPTTLSIPTEAENKRMLLVKCPNDFPDNFAKKNLISRRDAPDPEASQVVLPCVQGKSRHDDFECDECDGDWEDDYF